MWDRLYLAALGVSLVVGMALQALMMAPAVVPVLRPPVCASGELWESTSGTWSCSEVWT